MIDGDDYDFFGLTKYNQFGWMWYRLQNEKHTSTYDLEQFDNGF